LKPFAAILVVAAFVAGAAPGQAPAPLTPKDLAARAKADFEKVDAEPIPTVADTVACAQSNAIALSVARPEERYLLYYRKGYCELFSALPTGASDSFQAAANDFNEAIANWPKKAPTRPPGGLRALVSIAHLEQGRMADSYPGITGDLTATVSEPACFPTPVMATAFCNAVIDTARIWLGWLAYQRSEFAEAARLVEPLEKANASSAWALWIAGRLAQQQKRNDEATTLFEKTLAAWESAQKSHNPDVVTLLGPKLDAASVQYQLALSDYSRQRYDSAITRLDAVVKAAPRNSYAIFLRARSKDALHLNVAAMEDYALAAQTARASNDSMWSVGQANYYRGVLLYQARDYSRAEVEFANALGGRLGEIPPADVRAWQSMAGAAVRGCKSSSFELLESVVKAASTRFPKDQADVMIYDCRLKQASTVDQYLALEKAYSAHLEPTRLKDLRALIARFYADQGVAAEDRKDPYAAVIAYRRAIEWNAANTKAHFNLGAIYIEDKRYDLAEAEFRALVSIDPNDFEAHYWLGESILAQHPPSARVAEACVQLQRSLSIQDPARKADFTKAVAAAKCAN
jgi:tetratricopeptide (TPR) repeat protein